ncbi:bidirectional sugar transporter SWEET14-like [Corylus avellana]|uniref:bidirectional sugar transporter SWEET14-like n=1 Tax=Corylus avellana TaxID=13451 RepID=UPI00286D06A9|nr:bidirectional sugar transporter SWEET14-like [Corylus avellana]
MNSEQILHVVFEVLGAIVSLVMFLAPLPSFNEIRKKKSTEGLEWAPHVISLFKTTFFLYYAILKAKGGQVSRIVQVICMEVISGSIIGLTISQIHGVHERRKFVGWLSAAFNICGLGIPCYNMGRRSPRDHHHQRYDGAGVEVGRRDPNSRCLLPTIQAVTKNVEYSISRSSSLIFTVNAIIWLCNGVLLKDVIIAGY